MAGTIVQFGRRRQPKLRKSVRSTPAVFDRLTLPAKCARLQLEHPEAAAVVEQLVDSALRGWHLVVLRCSGRCRYRQP